MKGLLYFIIAVCIVYIIGPDPIPLWFDDFAVLGILILAAIGIKRSSSINNYSSDYDNTENTEDRDEDENNEEGSYQESTVYNYYSPGKTISLKCTNCGASLDLDLDNLLARCPYCNHKILIDTALLGVLIAEKGRTRREEERTRRQREIEEERTRREQEQTERERLKYQYELEKQRAEIAAKERTERRQRNKNIALFILIALIWIVLIYGHYHIWN